MRLMVDPTYSLTYGFHDVEDTFVAAMAVRERCDAIVTNNVKDYAVSPVPAVSPRELIAGISQGMPGTP